MYEKFYKICQKIKDKNGESLALNCIGVDYQLLMLKYNDNS